MKRLTWSIVLVLLAVPAMAQDDGGDGGGGGDFFNLEPMAGGFGDVGPDFNPINELRDRLAQANVTPMDKNQEKELKKIYDNEVKVVGKPYEKRFGISLKTAMGALQSSSRGRNGGGNFRRPESTQAAEARRLSEQLLDKMITALRINQQGPLRRYQSEQARLQKLNTILNSMAVAGTPLNSEQMTQIEAILARESRLRTLLIVEAKGEPYQFQLIQLEAHTDLRLNEVLDAPQRLAYAAATSRTNSPRRTPALRQPE